MKISFFVQQKLKLAALLVSIMVTILVANLFTKYNLEKIDEAFNSFYNDRLIPSSDLFYATENIHNKKLLMDAYFQDDQKGMQYLELGIKDSNRILDSLMHKYEKTFMVKEEAQTVNKLKLSLNKLLICEQNILARERKNRQAGQAVYEEKELPLIRESLAHLYHLENIQITVGQELFRKSQKEILENSSLSSIQIVIVVVIGLIANSLILSSKVANQAAQKFNLN